MPTLKVRNNQDAVSPRVRLTKEKRAKEPIPESESLKNFANPYQIKNSDLSANFTHQFDCDAPKLSFSDFLLDAINVSINF